MYYARQLEISCYFKFGISMTSNEQVVLMNVASKRDLNFLFPSFNLLHLVFH